MRKKTTMKTLLIGLLGAHLAFLGGCTTGGKTGGNQETKNEQKASSRGSSAKKGAKGARMSSTKNSEDALKDLKTVEELRAMVDKIKAPPLPKSNVMTIVYSGAGHGELLPGG